LRDEALTSRFLIGLLSGSPRREGKGDWDPEHANSICSFSGLNDTPDDPEEGGQVQSYGQIVRAGGKAFAPSPGAACKGHPNPLQKGNRKGKHNNGSVSTPASGLFPRLQP
jgi:hypothetical protein